MTLALTILNGQTGGDEKRRQDVQNSWDLDQLQGQWISTYIVVWMCAQLSDGLRLFVCVQGTHVAESLESCLQYDVMCDRFSVLKDVFIQQHQAVVHAMHAIQSYLRILPIDLKVREDEHSSFCIALVTREQ